MKKETPNEWAIRIIKEAGLDPADIKTVDLEEFVNSDLNAKHRQFDKNDTRNKRLYNSYNGIKNDKK